METWQTAEKGTKEGVLEMMQEYALDPVFLNYGAFLHPIKAVEYHPEYREEARKKEAKKLYKFSGNFYAVSWVFDLEVSEEDAKEIRKELEKHFKAEMFTKALKERFNALSLETCYYTNKTVNGKWYLHTKHDSIFDLNGVDSPEFLQAVKKEEERVSKNEKIQSYEVRPRYLEKHYLDSEYSELIELLGGNEKPIAASTQIRQASRRTVEHAKENNFELITLKSTGRKLYFKNNTYSMLWAEVDKITDFC